MSFQRVMAMMALCCVPAAGALADDLIPDELAGISIQEKPGSQLPLDLTFRNHTGQAVKLGSYFGDGRPVVMVLAYYSCPTLCTFVLNAVTEGLKDVAWNMGDKYRVVVVSIDPKDQPDVAAAKRANYLKLYDRNVLDNGWDFLMGDEASIKALADSLGFHYRWDEKTQQYAHAAGAFMVTPAGVLSRTLFGLSYTGRDLRLALSEASAGKLGTAWDKVLLFCYHYDPNARSYVLAASRLMSAGGLVTILLLGAFLVRLWRKDATQPMTRTVERAS